MRIALFVEEFVGELSNFQRLLRLQAGLCVGSCPFHPLRLTPLPTLAPNILQPCIHPPISPWHPLSSCPCASPRQACHSLPRAIPISAVFPERCCYWPLCPRQSPLCSRPSPSSSLTCFPFQYSVISLLEWHVMSCKLNSILSWTFRIQDIHRPAPDDLILQLLGFFFPYLFCNRHFSIC